MQLPISRRISKTILRLFGWKIEMQLPNEEKYLVIGAPHTSNWDFPLALLALSAMGLNYAWVGKHTLFRFPLGIFLRAIGGIPVDRHVRQGFIKQMIELFFSSPTLVLALAPEGTRSRTTYWKTGFYAIATEAAIPVALGYIDYQKKQLGIGATLYPSGKIEEDFSLLQQFYHDKTGKYPGQKSLVRIRKKDVQRLQDNRFGQRNGPDIPDSQKEDAHERQANREIDGHPEYRSGNDKGS